MATTGASVGVDPRAAALLRIHGLLRIAVAGAAVILLVWLLSGVLMVIFAAALLAVILHGAAAWLQRHTGMPFWASLAIVVVVIVAALAGLAFEAGPGLAAQATDLKNALAGQGQAMRARLSASEWGQLVLQQIPESLGGRKEGGLSNMPTGLAGSIAGILGSIFGLFGTLAVVVIAAIYLAADPSTYVDGAMRLVKPAHRPKAKAFCHAAGHALLAWSAGQALDMLAVGLLTGLGLWLLGVPLALVLGVIAGLANFVPYIGALVGAVPAVVIAFSSGPTTGFETVALFLAVQAFEGNVMAPFIQNRAVNLPPGLTVLSQTAFGAILGFPGLIFATPLTAALLAVADKATTPLRPEDEI